MAVVMVLGFVSFLYFQIFPAMVYDYTPTVISSAILAVCTFLFMMVAHFGYAMAISNWALRHAQNPTIKKPDPPFFSTLPVAFACAAATTGAGYLIYQGFSSDFARRPGSDEQIFFLVGPAAVQWVINLVASYLALDQAKQMLWRTRL